MQCKEYLNYITYYSRCQEMVLNFFFDFKNEKPAPYRVDLSPKEPVFGYFIGEPS